MKSTLWSLSFLIYNAFQRIKWEIYWACHIIKVYMVTVLLTLSVSAFWCSQTLSYSTYYLLIVWSNQQLNSLIASSYTTVFWCVQFCMAVIMLFYGRLLIIFTTFSKIFIWTMKQSFLRCIFHEKNLNESSVPATTWHIKKWSYGKEINYKLIIPMSTPPLQFAHQFLKDFFSLT